MESKNTINGFGQGVADLLDLADTLHRLDPGTVPFGELQEGVADLVRLSSKLDALRLRMLGEVDGRGGLARSGFMSTESWLVGRCGLGWAQATRQVKLAGALPDMPLTEAALSAGEIDEGKASQLATARDHDSKAFDADEEMLVRLAQETPTSKLRTGIQNWKFQVAAEQAASEAEALHQTRHLHMYRRGDGAVRVEADLDPEGGRIVKDALYAITDANNRDPLDFRTYGQRQADALVTICRDFLDFGDTVITGGQKPHLNLTVDYEVLRGSELGSGILDDEAVAVETARRIACDASVARIVTGPQSEPLDVGRRTRTIPAAIRTALELRDGGCVIDGCDTPARWCDAHHIIHWIDGGPTSLENLVLLCRRHHRMVHIGQLQVPHPQDRANKTASRRADTGHSSHSRQRSRRQTADVAMRLNGSRAPSTHDPPQRE